MKKLLISLGILGFIFVGCEQNKEVFLKRVTSQYDFSTTVKRLKTLIKEQKLNYFDTINHSQNAKDVGMNLKPESVIVFGNPKMGTVLMNCNPSMGLDLPLRILVSTDYEGITTLMYTNPEYWSLKHNIKDKNCLAIITKAKIALADLVEQTSQKKGQR